MTAFTSSLLESDPPIPGLNGSVVISTRRMHLTLGMMSLSERLPPPSPTLATSGDAPLNPPPTTQHPPTLASAIALLHELKPKVVDMLSGRPLKIVLQRMDIMRPDRGDLEKAHVPWVGPAVEDRESEELRMLKTVTSSINREFKKAGLVVDDRRPLPLHCTVLNTIYRKPRPRGGVRLPFSYPDVLESTALRCVEVVDPDQHTSPETERRKERGRAPIAIDLGEWPLDEIQICEMGSWGKEGEYVCVGRCTLSQDTN